MEILLGVEADRQPSKRRIFSKNILFEPYPASTILKLVKILHLLSLKCIQNNIFCVNRLVVYLETVFRGPCGGLVSSLGSRLQNTALQGIYHQRVEAMQGSSGI